MPTLVAPKKEKQYMEQDKVRRRAYSLTITLVKRTLIRVGVGNHKQIK